jgi:glycosyltransferase involved in cell wall biosynthesis
MSQAHNVVSEPVLGGDCSPAGGKPGLTFRQNMRQAIFQLLNNPEKAQAQAQRGYELVVKEYNSEQYVEGIAQRLTSL